MKETVSSIWSFQMVIVFMLIFAAFLALILVYSKAYSIKNNFLSIIEKYDGITNESLLILDNYARYHNYTATGSCPDDLDVWYGVLIDGDYVEQAEENTKYNYCFSEHHDARGLMYYNVVVFYRFNLPVLNFLGKYNIVGRTNSFRASSDRVTE